MITDRIPQGDYRAIRAAGLPKNIPLSKKGDLICARYLRGAEKCGEGCGVGGPAGVVTLTGVKDYTGLQTGLH